MEFKRAVKKTAIDELIDNLRQLCAGKTLIELQAMYKELRHQYREANRVEEALTGNEFNQGDKVIFDTKHGSMTGIVERVNKRSLSLHKCSDGRKWRVHFSYCTKISK